MLATLSSAIRDFKQLEKFTSNLREVACSWLDDGLVTVSAKSVSTVSCFERISADRDSADQFHWSGHIASGKAIEIKGLNGDITAEPAAGPDVEVVANKRAHRSDPNTVRIQVVEHAGGVTICAVYLRDDGQSDACEPGDMKPGQSSAKSKVRNNDVSVDFSVRIPANVDLIGRTVNGGINAKSLSGNVESHTVNGSIDISTTGYAQAKTVNGGISARLGNASWPGELEFMTINGCINLDLPTTVSTEITAETLNGEISSDFPLTLLGSFSRKHVEGTIGIGGRKLILKTLNGSINLRRAN